MTALDRFVPMMSSFPSDDNASDTALAMLIVRLGFPVSAFHSRKPYCGPAEKTRLPSAVITHA